MSQAPARMYCEPSQYAGEWTGTGDQVTEFDVSYVRADIADEMLAALKAADAHFTGTFSENGTDHQAIRAAIAKAESRQ